MAKLDQERYPSGSLNTTKHKTDFYLGENPGEDYSPYMKLYSSLYTSTFYSRKFPALYTASQHGLPSFLKVPWEVAGLNDSRK